MAQIPEAVLSWLSNCLHEYYDRQRTYADTVKVLAAYQPFISPRTETYTYENGTSALLLTVAGNIPVGFRGATYRFPIVLWVPHNYPREPPIVYVKPGKDMLVRPGQHVSVDGRVYHPYLRDWHRMWDRAGMVEFLSILQQVFSKEPPVINRAQQQQPQQMYRPPQAPAQPTLPPQLPPKQRSGSELAEMPGTGTLPPRPPKPGEESVNSPRNTATDGPPLPPLPHELARNPRTASSHQNYHPTPQVQHPPFQSPPPAYPASRQPTSPPPPALSQQHLLQPQLRQGTQDRSPVSPVSPLNGYSELPEDRYTRAVPLQAQRHPQGFEAPSMQNAAPSQYWPQSPYPQGPAQSAVAPQQWPAQAMPTQQNQQAKKDPPPDLLSDPFDLALPGLNTAGPTIPVPPIPPNPEKEHLLQAISTTLVQQAHQKVSQNMSALAPLQAQQIALRAAHERLEAEIRQVEQLDQALSRNEAILHRTIQDCDRTIEKAKTKQRPPTDEVLIAPTMVANQLWTLCAEEAACREAMYVLQRAVDRGRISGNDFSRQMRGLGRECFLKMALARKCAKGMGLDISR